MEQGREHAEMAAADFSNVLIQFNFSDVQFQTFSKGHLISISFSAMSSPPIFPEIPPTCCGYFGHRYINIYRQHLDIPGPIRALSKH